jgi:hypothetical protein
VDAESIDNDQICDVREELLCPLVDHSLTHGHLVILSSFASEVSLCLWGMNFGQDIDLFVHPAYSFQVPLYMGLYITFLHLQFLWPEI